MDSHHTKRNPSHRQEQDVGVDNSPSWTKGHIIKMGLQGEKLGIGTDKAQVPLGSEGIHPGEGARLRRDVFSSHEIHYSAHTIRLCGEVGFEHQSLGRGNSLSAWAARRNHQSPATCGRHCRWTRVLVCKKKKALYDLKQESRAWNHMPHTRWQPHSQTQSPELSCITSLKGLDSTNFIKLPIIGACYIFHN